MKLSTLENINFRKNLSELRQFHQIEVNKEMDCRSFFTRYNIELDRKLLWVCYFSKMNKPCLSYLGRLNILVNGSLVTCCES